MNKQGNTYTFLYAVVMVVIVAALLSVISLSLQPLQEKNRMNEKRQNILSAINITSDATTAEELLTKYVKEQYVINAKGEKISGKQAFDIDIAVEYSKNADSRNLPVYVANIDGATKYILPIYGAGLWGPIWGYISLNEDKKTVYGIFLGHQGETPGLGAEIATENFTSKFQNINIQQGSGYGIAIVKGAANNQVESISGGTITSKGVEAMLKSYLTNYEAFLK